MTKIDGIKSVNMNDGDLFSIDRPNVSSLIVVEVFGNPMVRVRFTDGEDVFLNFTHIVSIVANSK